MAEYRQANVSGVIWHRFARIEIDNPRGGIPTIACAEHAVISADGEEVTRDVGTLRFDFDSAANFQILDPSTNDVQSASWLAALPLGMQTYVLIYSYVLYQAAIRDAAI